jgi:hypothetical protein
VSHPDEPSGSGPGPHHHDAPSWKRYFSLTAAVFGIVLLISRAWPSSRLLFPSDLPPLFVRWHPLTGPLIVLPLGIVVGLWLWLPRLLGCSRRARLAVLVLVAWVLAETLAMQSGHARRFQPTGTLDGYAIALTQVLSRPSDYFNDAPLIERIGPRSYAERYPALVGTPRISYHSWTHPPGAALLEWGIWRIGDRSRLLLALAIGGLGALGIIPTESLARAIGGEAAGTNASVMFATAPAVLLFSATSADALFMTITAVAFALAVRATRSRTWAVAAGASITIALCFTWGALALGAFGLGYALIRWRLDRTTRLSSTFGWAAIGLVASGLLVRAVLGLDLVAVFRANVHQQLDFPSIGRSYSYWVFGNVAAFLLTLGIPVTSALARATVRAWESREPYGVVGLFWLLVLAATLVGVFRGETDHNWLFLAPLGVAVGASAIGESWLRPSVAVGIGQAILTEVLFYTGW